jgi:hypothetical protein
MRSNNSKKKTFPLIFPLATAETKNSKDLAGADPTSEVENGQVMSSAAHRSKHKAS